MTSECRHVFPVLGRTEGVREVSSRKQLKKIEPFGLQWKVENERLYETAISDFQNLDNSEKRGIKL